MTKPLPDKAKLIPTQAKKVFEGEIHDVFHWQQKMYDGSHARFEMLRRPDTVYILAINDEEKVALLTQEQPDREEHFSLPAGRVDPGEDVLSAAKRELVEETGLVMHDWSLKSVSQPHTKFEWFSYFFVARNVTDTKQQTLDNGEKISWKFVEYSKIVNLMLREELSWVYPMTQLLMNGKDQLSDILTLSDITTNA